MAVDQETLRLLIDSNTQLQLELDEKRELNEKAVQKSVNKILEQERKMNRQVIEEREVEIKGLMGQLSEYHTENVRVKNEIASVREELRQFKAIAEKLSNEKKGVFDDKQLEIESLRQESELERSQL